MTSAMLPQTRLGALGIAALFAALAAVPLLVPPYYVELATMATTGAMLALSLQLLVGVTGLVSLGHGAFYGLAAYTVYLITPADAGLPIWMTLPAAMLAAGFEPVTSARAQAACSHAAAAPKGQAATTLHASFVSLSCSSCSSCSCCCCCRSCKCVRRSARS